MAAPRHPRPTAEQVEAHKGKYDSRATLSRALAYQQSTINKWCQADPEFMALMDGARVGRGPTSREEVVDTDRLKAAKIEDELREHRRLTKDYEKALLSQEEFFN